MQKCVLVYSRIGKYKDWYQLRWQEDVLAFYFWENNGRPEELQAVNDSLREACSKDILLHANQIREIRIKEPEASFDALKIVVKCKRGWECFYVEEECDEECLNMLSEYAQRNGVQIDTKSLTDVKAAEAGEPQSAQLLIPILGLWVLAAIALYKGHAQMENERFVNLLPLVPALLLYLLQLVFPNRLTFATNKRAAAGKVRMTAAMCCFNLIPTLFMFQYQWLNLSRLIGFSAAVFAVLIIGYLIRIREYRKKPAILLTVVILLAWYSLTAVGISNIALTRQEPLRVQAAFWDDFGGFRLVRDGEVHEVNASDDLLVSAQEGDSATVLIYEGAWRIPAIILE